jgi:hypothetical protein
VNAQSFGGNQANDAGAYAGVAPMLSRAPTTYQAPSTNLDGNTFAADQERKAAISELESRLTSLGSLNSNGKRDLASQLIGLKAQLTRDAYGQQGELAKAGAQINADGSRAALDANASADQNAANIGAIAGENNLRRKFDFDFSGNTVRGANGDVYLQRGASVTPVTGPDGKPFQGAPDKTDVVSKEAQYKDLGAQIAAMAQVVPPPGKEDEYARQLAQLRDQQSRLTGPDQSAPAAGAPPADAIALLKKNPSALRAHFDATFGADAAARALGE